MKKVLSIVLLFLLIGVISNENKVVYAQDGILELDQNNFGDRFEYVGSAKYDRNQKAITLTENLAIQTGMAYLNQRISLYDDFRIEIDFHAAASGTGGQGFAVGFTESEIKTKGRNSDFMGVSGTKNTTAFMVDTYKNSSDQAEAPNVSVRYTKEASTALFYDQNGNSTGRYTTHSIATLISESYIKQRSRMIITYDSKTEVITFQYAGKILTGVIKVSDRSKGVAFFMSATNTGQKDIINAYIRSARVGINTETPNDLVITESGNSYILKPIKQNGQNYESGSELIIADINQKLIIQSNGTATVSKANMPRYDIKNQIMVKEPNKTKSGPLEKLIPGRQTETPTVSLQLNRGRSYIITLLKPDKTKYSQGDIVTIEGINRQFTINSDSRIELTRTDFFLVDTRAKFTVKNLNKLISEYTEVLLRGSQTTHSENQLQTQDYYGNLTLKLEKISGETYDLGTQVTIRGKQYLVDLLGNISINASELKDENETIDVTIKEDDRTSINISLEILGLNSSDRKKIEKRITEKKDEAISMINALNGVSSTQKSEYQVRINQIYLEQSEKLNRTLSNEDGELVYDETISRFGSIQEEGNIEIYKVQKLNDLNDYMTDLVNKINRMTHLNDEVKKEYIALLNGQKDKIFDEINGQTTVKEIDEILDQGKKKLNDIYLEIYKKQAVEEIKEKVLEAKTELEELQIDDDKKLDIANIIDTIIMVNSENSINNSQSIEFVDFTVNSTKLDLKNIMEQARIESAKNLEDITAFYKKSLKEKSEEVTLEIGLLHDLKDLKQSFLDEVLAKYSQKETALNNSSSLEDLKTIYQTGIVELIDIGEKARFENAKKFEINRLEEITNTLKERVSNKELDLAIKQQYISELEQELETATSNIGEKTTINEISQEGKRAIDVLNAITFRAYKEEVDVILTNRKNTLLGMIDNLPTLTDDEKATAKAGVNNEYSDKIGSISTKTTRTEVSKIVSEIQTNMLTKYSDIEKLSKLRTNGLEEINQKYQKIEEVVNKSTIFNDEQRNDFLSNTRQAALTPGTSEISSESLEMLETTIRKWSDLLSFIEFGVNKEYAYDEMNQVIDRIHDLIINLEPHITKAEKEEIEQLLSVNYNNYFDLIFDSNDLDEINDYKSKNIEYTLSIYDGLTKLNDERKAVENEINDYIKNEVKEGIITEELKTFIDSTKETAMTQKTAEDTIKEKEAALKKIKDYLDSKIEEAKKRVKDELEASAKKPISDVVQKIIDDHVAKVDGTNYSDKEEIDFIIADGKNNILEEELKAYNSAKENALKEIKEKYDEVVSKNITEEEKKRATEIYNEALKDIEGATNINEVNKVKEKTLEAFDNIITKSETAPAYYTWIFITLILILIGEITFIYFKLRKRKQENN